MSLDEEFESQDSDLPLINVLNNRDDAVSTSELWAILKETCIALKTYINNIEPRNFQIDVNCLMIDSSGNIKIHFDSSNLIRGAKKHDHFNLINSIGETMMNIMSSYANVDSTNILYQYITELMVTEENDFGHLDNIEIYADRQLNGSSVDVSIHNDFANLKKSDDYSSAFQDSFLSTEYSLNTESEADSDQSLYLTKDQDTLSCKSESISSTDSVFFLSLNQLWSHCFDRIIQTDLECLVLVYAILKEISNNLLNDVGNNCCLCISTDNILMDRKGKILINFSSELCFECGKEKLDLNNSDIKYVNKIGAIVFEIVRSDHRIVISNYVCLILQRMIDSQDMIINDVLTFCKTHINHQDMRCSSILIRLFDRWKYWYDVHLEKLVKLKHKYLYDISTKNLNQFLKRVSTKLPMTVKELFKQDSSLSKGLKFVTKLSDSRFTIKKKRNPIILNHHQSAFQPYRPPTNNYSSTLLPSGKPSRLKDSTHFRPLVLTSECHSIYQSQENITSPIGVLPQYSKRTFCCSNSQYNTLLGTGKTWQSVSHLPTDDTNMSLNRLTLKHQSSFSRSSHNKSQASQSLFNSQSSKSLKINTIINIIQSNIKIQSDSFENLNDRQILSIADFALSLETLTENVFIEAIKQRFPFIKWSQESLKELYEIINESNTEELPLSDGVPVVPNKTVTIDNKPPIKTNVHINKESQSSSSKTEVKITEKSKCIPSDNEEMTSDCDKQADTFVNRKPSQIVKTASVFIKKSKIESPASKNVQPVKQRRYSDSDESCISDYRKSLLINTPESTSFYEIIHPGSVLCFPATANTINPDRNPIIDFSINENNFLDLLSKFFSHSQSIQVKFKELCRTKSLIGKSIESNDKKLTKQFFNDQNDLQKNLEAMFIYQMDLESMVVEYHSVNIEPILEEIKLHCFDQSIRFSNEVRNFRNLQMIQPYALVACLFCKGAVTSGLLYEFFLIYREFYTPVEFVSVLSTVFLRLLRRLVQDYRQLINAKFRLLFIILCWIDGFYKIDFDDTVISKVMSLVNKYLVSHLKNCLQIVENTMDRSKTGNPNPLVIQVTHLKNGMNSQMDLVGNIDIQSKVSEIEKNRKEKQKIFQLFSLNFERIKKTSHQDVLSILDISPKELAICFTLIEQNIFNGLHPCHLLLYLNSLSCTEESILQTIQLHRFSSNSSINDDVSQKEILTSLRLSGKITHWAISEILKTTDSKLQGKIVKVLLVTCMWCIELNNYSTTFSILEAVNSNTLKWAPFWNHVKPKTLKVLKEIENTANQFSRNTSNLPINDKHLQNSFLVGSPFLPCVHTMLVSLKLAMVGKTVTKDGCLKWSKLKKISDNLDQIRLYLQFRYVSCNSEIRDLKRKLLSRINHLTSISLDILQSHNMLAQET